MRRWNLVFAITALQFLSLTPPAFAQNEELQGEVIEPESTEATPQAPMESLPPDASTPEENVVAPESEKSPPPLEEITVTARRRLEKAKDVPVSVSALRGDDTKNLRAG